MRLYINLFLLLSVFFCASRAFPVNSNTSSKGVDVSYGQPFDEIVVASSLTVRRKNLAREARNEQNSAKQKREVNDFSETW